MKELVSKGKFDNSIIREKKVDHELENERICEYRKIRQFDHQFLRETAKNGRKTDTGKSRYGLFCIYMYEIPPISDFYS